MCVCMSKYTYIHAVLALCILYFLGFSQVKVPTRQKQQQRDRPFEALFFDFRWAALWEMLCDSVSLALFLSRSFSKGKGEIVSVCVTQCIYNLHPKHDKLVSLFVSRVFLLMVFVVCVCVLCFTTHTRAPKQQTATKHTQETNSNARATTARSL